MSINPVSDIVLDVASAADPSASLAATQRLAQLGSAASADGGFAGAMTLSDPGKASLQSQISLMRAKQPGWSPAPIDARTKAYKGLEELLLQRMVETMLPKDDSAVFGGGTAGDVWRSMLAEQLAKQMGKSVDLGLVKSAGAANEPAHDAAAAVKAQTPAESQS